MRLKEYAISGTGRNKTQIDLDKVERIENIEGHDETVVHMDSGNMVIVLESYGQFCEDRNGGTIEPIGLGGE